MANPLMASSGLTKDRCRLCWRQRVPRSVTVEAAGDRVAARPVTANMLYSKLLNVARSRGVLWEIDRERPSCCPALAAWCQHFGVMAHRKAASHYGTPKPARATNCEMWHKMACTFLGVSFSSPPLEPLGLGPAVRAGADRIGAVSGGYPAMSGSRVREMYMEELLPAPVTVSHLSGVLSHTVRRSLRLPGADLAVPAKAACPATHLRGGYHRCRVGRLDGAISPTPRNRPQPRHLPARPRERRIRRLTEDPRSNAARFFPR